MTLQTWQSLCNKKYRLSLRLFLLLNAISALFSIALPLYNLRILTIPVCIIFAASLVLPALHHYFPGRKINITLISLIFGCLWAWHVITKVRLINDNADAFLLIALLSILFIGTIAFSNHILAFLFHSLPVFISCLWLSSGESELRMVYSFALPVLGISIQHAIQKRNDHFAQALMNRLMQERKTLNDLSMLDPLTGLYNRRGLQHKLDNLLAVDDSPRYVLLLDIDHFKAYNDHYGHMMGDQALIRVSAALRNAVRSRDIVARFGGEEFMILINNAEQEDARRTAERIRQQVYDLKIPHMFNESVATNVTVSIGIAPLLGNDIDASLSRADKALYEAKHMGRNNILVSEELQPV
ncbi:GGDEF domain-containing protein [Kosakonia oryzendophytica]|uniref:GGDEF domain-containing protein n=1 Tax=Kosakonia oryzendophytica TaxID=1005665 RepID=UPI003D34A922